MSCRPTTVALALALSLTALTAGCSGGGSPSAGEQVGQLADLRVQGLTYATLSRTGETDEEGRYRYLPGEEVAFYLGSVRIGSAPGRPDLSLFDLTGAPMPTANHGIARALAHDPAYRRLANSNQLLATFDLDGRPENGIELTPAIASLFHGAAIDLEQDVELFQHDAAVRSRLAFANEQGLLGEARTMMPTVRALGCLYAASHVTEAGFAPRRAARDTDVDGTLDDSSERHYTDGGELGLCTHDLDGDGAPELVTERIAEATGERIETRPGLDAAPSSVRHVHRDARGNRVSMLDADADGTADAVQLTIVDGRGRTIAEVSASDAGPQQLVVTLYGPHGRRSTTATYRDLERLEADLAAAGVEFEIDSDTLAADLLAAASPDSSHRFRYDAGGREIEQAYDRDGDDQPDSYVYQSYDAAGRLRLRELDNDGDGVVDSMTWKTYDAAGNEVRSESDADADGDLDIVSWAEYDAAGNLLRRSRDDGADGTADEVTQWEYDVYGNPVTRRNDHDGDGVVDSITHTYWVPGVWNAALESAGSVASCLEAGHL